MTVLWTDLWTETEWKAGEGKNGSEGREIHSEAEGKGAKKGGRRESFESRFMPSSRSMCVTRTILFLFAVVCASPSSLPHHLFHSLFLISLLLPLLHPHHLASQARSGEHVLSPVLSLLPCERGNGCSNLFETSILFYTGAKAGQRLNVITVTVITFVVPLLPVSSCC